MVGSKCTIRFMKEQDDWFFSHRLFVEGYLVNSVLTSISQWILLQSKSISLNWKIKSILHNTSINIKRNIVDKSYAAFFLPVTLMIDRKPGSSARKGYLWYLFSMSRFRIRLWQVIIYSVIQDEDRPWDMQTLLWGIQAT